MIELDTHASFQSTSFNQWYMVAHNVLKVAFILLPRFHTGIFVWGGGGNVFGTAKLTYNILS